MNDKQSRGIRMASKGFFSSQAFLPFSVIITTKYSRQQTHRTIVFCRLLAGRTFRKMRWHRNVANNIGEHCSNQDNGLSQTCQHQ